MVKRGLILGGVLAVISGVFVSSCYAATSGTTKFSVDVDDTVLELTVPASPAVIDLNPTITGASFGSTNVTVKVATNNITGYQLTMTPTNSQTNTSLIRTELVGSESTYREIETLDLTDPVSTGYPEADFTANKWGYKITGDNYYGIDPNNTTVSHPSWTTGEPTNGTNHNLTLAAKVDASTVSGSYETTLNFRAVTNAIPKVDIISFDGNGADSGDMSNESVTVAAGSIATLPASTYTKSNYRFIGWNTRVDGTGLSYADRGEYTSTATNENQDITLYAMWSNLPEGASTSGTTPDGNPGVTISLAYEIAYTAAGKGMWEETAEGSNIYTQIQDGMYHNRDVRWDLQGMTTNICNSVTVLEDSYLAIDTRDFHKYNITKLKDERCWLQDNLALNLTMDNAEQIITIDNTNADATALQALFHGYRSQGANYATRGVVDYSSAESYSYGMMYKGLINATNSSDAIEVLRNVKYGIHYNFCAATAGSYCYGNDWDPYESYGDASQDICPTGWRLPIGGVASKNEYQLLYDKYLSIPDVRIALRLPFSGNFQFYSGSELGQGDYGRFWSSSRGDNKYLVDDLIVRNVYWPNDTGYRNDGYSVRCIAK